MDFQLLAKQTILQENNQEDAVSNSSVEFLTKKFETLKKDYEQKYSNYVQFRNAFPSEQEYKILIYNAANAAVRTVQDSDRYPNIRDIFPILDVVGLTVQSYSQAGGSSIQNKAKQAEESYIEFVNRLKTVKGAPLEYEPISPWAKKVKDDFFAGRQKIDFGKLRLESAELQNKSLYFVIHKLFELRMTGKSNILKLDADTPAKSKRFIDQFLLDPNVFISGTKPIPEESIRDMYNDLKPELILEVAKNAYEFFIQQADVNLGGIEALKGTEKAAYQKFLINSIDWNFYKPQTNNTLQTSSLTTFSSLVTTLLTELTEEQQMSLPGFEDSDSNKQEQEVETDPFKNKNGKSDYSLQHIINNKSKVPAANNLYLSLVKLADYVRKQAELNWKGIFSGLAQIAQGLSFGVPTLGGKR